MKLHACAHCPRRALPVCEVSALWRIHVVVSGSKLRCCQPLFNLVTARHTPGMHYLAIDHHAGCAHHAVAHDVAQLFHLFQLDCHAFGLGDLVDERNGGFAVGTTGAEYFDVHEGFLKMKLKNMPLQHCVKHKTHQQDAAGHHADKGGNQPDFQHLAQDDHLGQREGDDTHHEGQHRAQSGALGQQGLHDRDHTGGVGVHRHADDDG